MAGEKPKILLVDDRPENLLALEAALAGIDCEPSRAESGREALDLLLRDADFALILLDVAMPELDGFETATLVRARAKTRHIPIIFVTASVQDAAQVFRGYETGAVDYLVKPLDVHALRAKTAVFLDLWRKTREIERAAEALREADRRERHLLETLYDVTFEDAPIGIGHASTHGTWLRVNRRLATILGRPPEQVNGTPIGAFVHADDREKLTTFIRGVGDSGEPRHRGEYRLLRPDQTVVWIALTFSLVRDLDGKVVQLAIVEDITEEKRLAIALDASERRFARLRDSDLLGVYHEDAAGTVTDANEAFLSIIGYTRDDVEAGRVQASSLTAAESADADARARQDLAHSGLYRAYEKTLTRKDGRTRRVLTGAVRNAGLIGFALDVTALREAEEVRARGLREWEKSLRVRDDFIALAAHELRNPLTPLVMQMSSLRAIAASPGAPIERRWLAQNIEIAQRATARLVRFVDDLLAVSRATVGRVDVAPEEVDLAAVVRDVVDDTRAELKSSGCTLTVNAPWPVRGSWDRFGVERVVANLLSNALKHGRQAPVEVSVEDDGADATVAIRDHGPGLPPEERTSIFERYERLAPQRHFGGLGLGLWIARQIVEAHHGAIDVWSEPEEGTCFTVRLPKSATVEAHAASAS